MALRSPELRRRDVQAVTDEDLAGIVERDAVFGPEPFPVPRKSGDGPSQMAADRRALLGLRDAA
jgi:hypothetical protein